MIEFLPAVEQDILGNREIPQGHVKVRRFPASAAPGRERLGFDHEQVEVGIGAGISARAREPKRMIASGDASQTMVSTIWPSRASSVVMFSPELFMPFVQAHAFRQVIFCPSTNYIVICK